MYDTHWKVTPVVGIFWPLGYNFNKFKRGPLYYIPNIKGFRQDFLCSHNLSKCKTFQAWDGVIFAQKHNLNKLGKVPLGDATYQILTLYPIIMPFDAFEIVYVFENIMENGAFALWSKCSIFHNIFRSIQNLLKSFLIFFQCRLKI